MKIQKKSVCISLGMFVANLIFFLLFSQAAFAEIEITPGISLSETYEDNLYLADQNKISDYITAVSPDINLAHLSENTQFNLYYRPSFVWYADQTKNDTVRHTARLGWLQQLSNNLSLQLSDTYYKSEEPVEETEGIEGIRTTRNVYHRNTGYVELQYHFGSENIFNLGYNNRILVNEDPTLDDGIIHRPYMGYTYWFDIKNGIDLNFDYTKAEYRRDDGLPPRDDYQGLGGGIAYSHRFNTQTTGTIGYDYTVRYFDGLTEDYQVHDASLGLTHSFSPTLNISLQYGQWYQVRERTPEDTYGPKFSASLNKSFSRGSFQISGQGGWDEEYLDAEDRGFTRFWSFRSGFNYQIAETIYSRAAVSYRQDEDDFDRFWATISGTLGLTWNFHRYFDLSLDYSYRNRDDDVTTSNYNRNQIMLTLSAKRLFRL